MPTDWPPKCSQHSHALLLVGHHQGPCIKVGRYRPFQCYTLALARLADTQFAHVGIQPLLENIDLLIDFRQHPGGIIAATRITKEHWPDREGTDAQASFACSQRLLLRHGNQEAGRVR
ncbi:MAG: hypothetical protein QOJ58_4891 [Alphaproteobacteria bacterium]|nr:hypothetical protein [Alphaproteobacteria bacterium]